MPSCAVCGAPLQAKAGPGRPPVYCGEPCRRVVEWRIRSITRRLAAYEIEIREVDSGSFKYAYLDYAAQRKRVRDLRRWVRQDETELHRLFGREGHGEALTRWPMPKPATAAA